jgi:hypothetical protein
MFCERSSQISNISEFSTTTVWGAKIVDRLAQDLRVAFPDMTGFSTRNLKCMRAFAEAYPDESIVQAAPAQFTWYHNCTLLDKDLLRNLLNMKVREAAARANAVSASFVHL